MKSVKLSRDSDRKQTSSARLFTIRPVYFKNLQCYFFFFEFLAAAGSLTSELGLALDSSGKIMLFASFCNGIKSDVSIEFDVVLGFWTGIDKILGDTVSIGVGSDILELESGTEEEGGNVELVFSKKDGFVGGTLSIGYGYGPEIEFPVELNLDRCSTYELRRFDLRAIAAKVFHWIALFLDKKISHLKV